MLVVRVELHSAVTGRVTEIARMLLWNDGNGTSDRGDYKAKAVKGRDEEPTPVTAAWKMPAMREGEVKNYPRKNLHVWNLVGRMLTAMGYK